MIRTLRAYFLSRLLREKVLLLGLILIGTLIWLSSFGTRASQFWRTRRDTSDNLTEQQRWLNDRVKIEADLQKAASHLESSKTLDQIRLRDALNHAAQEAGLRTNFGSSSPSSETNNQFTVHSVEFRVTQADFTTLQRFYLNVQQRAPYIGITSFALQPNPADPSKQTLVLRVAAVEIPR